jgi:hypothetical protein
MAILYRCEVFAMGTWQLRLALVCSQVRQVDVWILRGAGCAVRVLTRDGQVHALCPSALQRLWPAWPPLKECLQRCGVHQVVLHQPESHDEIIGRPVMLETDPGLCMPLR